MKYDKRRIRWLGPMPLIIAFLLLAVGTLAFLWIDRSISYSYLQAGSTTTAQSYERVSVLLQQEWMGLTEGEIWDRLNAEAKRLGRDEITLKRDTTESVIWFDNVRFEFESGRLKKIR